jgi:hypothetical protein
MFEDFRGGCPGVTGAERNAGVPRRQRNGFVAAQQQSVWLIHSIK